MYSRNEQVTKYDNLYGVHYGIEATPEVKNYQTSNNDLAQNTLSTLQIIISHIHRANLFDPSNLFAINSY